MTHEHISTSSAPAAIGPYSQAIRFSGNMVFTSGQIPLDSSTGEVIAGGIAEQTLRVMNNLAAILQAAGTDLSLVVKTTVFLKSMADFAGMNEVYAKFFTDKFPARSTVEVSRLPKDVLVEIECLAIVP